MSFGTHSEHFNMAIVMKMRSSVRHCQNDETLYRVITTVQHRTRTSWVHHVNDVII